MGDMLRGEGRTALSPRPDQTSEGDTPMLADGTRRVNHCTCSGHRNDPEPCPSCEADTRAAESVEDELHLGKLNEELVEWAVQNWDGPRGVAGSLWECEAQRAVREAMQEFFSEHPEIGDKFAQWVLETMQIETRKRNRLLDRSRYINGLRLEPDVREPNAQARLVIATVEGYDELRERFLTDETERRMEASDGD